MRPSSPRIPPLSPDQFDEEQAAIAQGRAAYNFTRVLVHHPALYRPFIPFAEQLILRSSLPPRDREILILRTTVLCGEAYETAHHVSIARSAGLSEPEIAAIEAGEGEPLSIFDRALLIAAKELVHDHCIQDQTWQILAERYSRLQLMEVVFLVGQYTMVSMVTNSFGMQFEGS